MARDSDGGAVRSMTGFASGHGTLDGQDWTWDIKGVNGRGLDLRLRLPDRIDGLEPEVRKRAQAVLTRGNVTIGLRMASSDTASAVRIDPVGLAAALDVLAEIAVRAVERDVALTGTTAAEVAAMRGVLDTSPVEVPAEALGAAVLQSFDAALLDFDAARLAEGAALHALLSDQIASVERLTAAARDAAARRPEAQRDAMARALARLGDDIRVDEARFAQELALIAIKQDVTEELDRLDAHIAAARGHLDTGGPIGRKLDFLMQEFNREANTLCSKSQSSDLTAIGLDLKAAIEQMREQVQNIE